MWYYQSKNIFTQNFNDRQVNCACKKTDVTGGQNTNLNIDISVNIKKLNMVNGYLLNSEAETKEYDRVENQHGLDPILSVRDNVVTMWYSGYDKSQKSNMIQFDLVAVNKKFMEIMYSKIKDYLNVSLGDFSPTEEY